MAKTVSMSVGKVAPLHDVRREPSANVDPTLTHQNEIFIDKLAPFNYDIEAFTNAKYQPVLDAFNATQKRADRKKTKPYVEYIKEENAKLEAKQLDNNRKGLKKSVRKPTKLVHEYVLQIGDRETNGTSDPNTDIDANREYARKVVERIQKKYKHVDVLLATFHADEPNGTPHLHLIVQFDGDGYQKGLQQQISMSKALEQDGFARDNTKGNYAINRFTEDIKDTIMTETLDEVFHEEREIIGEHRPHVETPVFRRKAKEEQKYIDEKYDELSQTRDNLVEYRNQLIQAKKSLEARESTLEAEKAEFEAYKASETQKIQELQQQTELKEQNAESHLQHSRRMFRKAHDSILRADKAWDEIVEARKLPLQPIERAGRMAKFMGRYKMSDGRTLYQHFQDAEPKMIETERENERLMAEINRKYGNIRQSFNDDYEVDFP